MCLIMSNKKWLKIILLLVVIGAFVQITSAGISEMILGEQERPINEIFWIAGLSFLAILIIADFTGKQAENVGSHLGAAVGIILIAVSSSLPELFVSILSSLQGHANIAIANVIGSNMANVALILGVISILRPVKLQRGFAKSFTFLLLMVAVIVAIFFKVGFFPQEITYSPIAERIILPQEGIILMALFAVYCLLMNVIGMGEAPSGKGAKLGTAIFLTLVGGVGVWLSAEFAIDALIKIAIHYQISETIIAATLIAVGTSLPEFAMSIIATVKAKSETSFGNLIASNVFNSTVCLGVAALIGAFVVSSSIISFHLPFMLLMSVTVFFMSFKNEIKRTDGIILLIIYAAYVVLMLSGEPVIFPY